MIESMSILIVSMTLDSMIRNLVPSGGLGSRVQEVKSELGLAAAAHGPASKFFTRIISSHRSIHIVISSTYCPSLLVQSARRSRSHAVAFPVQETPRRSHQCFSAMATHLL